MDLVYEALVKSLEHAPALGVLAFVVYIFLKHIKEQGHRDQEIQSELKKSIDANTQAVANNTVSIVQLSSHIKHK